MSETQATKARRKREMPFTRLEIVVLGLVAGQLQVLLAKRAGEPFKGQWALPGGVLYIEDDDTLDDAARRVARERLGLELPFLRQVGAVGGKARDPDRSAWALSVIYRAFVRVEDFSPTAGKRTEELAWRPAAEATEDKRIAFDHAALIGRAVDATLEEVRRLDLPYEALPDKFTLGELQAWCEEVLGERLDKSSFRRRLPVGEHVVPVEGEMKVGAFRPAQVYRARSTS